MGFFSKIGQWITGNVEASAGLLTGNTSLIAAGTRQMTNVLGITHATPVSTSLTGNLPGDTVTTGTQSSTNIVFWILGILVLIIIMSTKKRKR
jgi:LPXTG-motif cell wall-anchored protein